MRKASTILWLCILYVATACGPQNHQGSTEKKAEGPKLLETIAVDSLVRNVELTFEFLLYDDGELSDQITSVLELHGVEDRGKKYFLHRNLTGKSERHQTDVYYNIIADVENIFQSPYDSEILTRTWETNTYFTVYAAQQPSAWGSFSNAANRAAIDPLFSPGIQDYRDYEFLIQNDYTSGSLVLKLYQIENGDDNFWLEEGGLLPFGTDQVSYSMSYTVSREY